jgi:hypothetical protein
MNRIAALICLALLAVCIPVAARADALKLTFHRVVQGPAGTQPQEDNIALTLLPRAFITEQPHESIAYDFTARHMIVLDNDRLTAITGSLYAFPIFKAVERESRMAMSAMQTKAGGKSGTPENPLWIDMALGSDSTAGGTAKLIETTTANGTTSFTGGGETLASYTNSGTVIPPELRDSYRKFIVYTMMLHPVIKEALAQEPDVFARLTFRRQSRRGSDDVTYTLTGVTPVNIGDFAIPANYKTIYSDDPKLDALIRQSIASPAPTLKAEEAAINAMIVRGDIVDADLALDEMTLTAPDKLRQDRAFLEASFNKVVKDPKVKILQQALMQPPNNEIDLAQQLALFERTKARAHDKAYMLDLQEAVAIRSVYNPSPALTKEQVQKLNQSLDLFKASLVGNPWLTGGWFDLGFASYADLDMPTAWTCWDQGRRLNPDFPMAVAIRDMETRAVKDFPEYF